MPLHLKEMKLHLGNYMKLLRIMEVLNKIMILYANISQCNIIQINK